MEIISLLNQVAFINKKYEEIADITGDRFNIFQILGVESKEVKMHSNFIAELLNPKGSHGQKAEFLRLFVKQFNIDNFDEDKVANSNTHVELDIGRINEDYTEGGRIDIIVRSSLGGEIIIENKIYAQDQFNQLLRYKNAYPSANIFYLTLHGDSPSPESKGNIEDKDFKCISYSNDIIKWLELSREKAIMLPMLRECISQYINLIKHLTHQSTNKLQEMEIEKLILESKEKFDSAQEISKTLLRIIDYRKSYFSELLNLWEKKYGSIVVEIFEYFDYKFYIKPSNEDNYIHFDIFLYKNKIFQVANDSDISQFRNLAQLFDGRIINEYNFYFNNNYTSCVRSQFDIDFIDFEKFKSYIENKNEWIKNILEEGVHFVNHILEGVKKMAETDSNIKVLLIN